MTNANTTALLVGHIQRPVSELVPDQSSFYQALQSVLTAAREKGVQIIYLNVGFRPGYPELSLDSSARSELEPHGIFLDGVSNAVDERIVPLDCDIQIITPGPDVFPRTALASILRAKGITSFAIQGISTGGVVNGTVVGAYSEGFNVAVLKDLCFEPGGDASPDALFDAFVRPWGATVTTSDEWLDSVTATA